MASVTQSESGLRLLRLLRVFAANPPELRLQLSVLNFHFRLERAQARALDGFADELKFLSTQMRRGEINTRLRR